MDVTVQHQSNRSSFAEVAADVDRLVGDGVSRDLMIGGAFEGASQFDRSLALWNPPLLSADAEILPEKATLDARVRDVRRNDGYVQTGQVLHRDHIVGSMYLLNSAPSTTVLGLDETWAEEFQEEVEAKFMLAAESDDCWFDAARKNTLTGLVRLAVGVYATGGEALATAEWIRETNRPFKTAVQFVDADRLSTPYEKMAFGERVRGGIRQNRYGAPLGYYIRDAHATDADRWADSMSWTYVPARKPWGRMQVFHAMEQMRIEQSRGVADIVAGLKETRIAKKFRDITLQQAVVSAMYAASIESDLPSEAVFSQMGAGNIQSPGVAAANYAGDYLAAIAQYAGSSKHMQIDGVRIPHFFPGTRLQVRQVGAPGGVGQEFETSLLRYLAAILGVSYEELSRDFSKTNYSSARAAMMGTWRFMQSRKKIVADRMANFIYLLWLEEMFNAEEITSLPRNAPNFYDPLMKEAYGAATWIGAARGQIDELKETQAAVLRIKYGLSTREAELARLGTDWRKVFAQLEREQKDAERRNLVFVEDNAINAASGAPREKEASEDTGEGKTNGE